MLPQRDIIKELKIRLENGVIFIKGQIIWRTGVEELIPIPYRIESWKELEGFERSYRKSYKEL